MSYEGDPLIWLSLVVTAGDTALPGGNGSYEVPNPLTESEGGSLTTTHTVQPYEIPVVTVKVLAMDICSIILYI